jgi:hypothetical protein
LASIQSPHADFNLRRIIAIMIRRLKMTIAECLRAYRTMAQRAFIPIDKGILGWMPKLPGPPRGNFSGSSLEGAVRGIVEEYTGDQEVCFADKTCCKTYFNLL